MKRLAIDDAAEALENLPEKTKEKLSLREAVDALREQITAVLDKGYSYEDIAAMLEQKGVSIAPSSLKHYLARSNRQLKQANGETQARRKRASVRPADNADVEDLPDLTSAIAAEAEPESAPKRRGRPPASESAPAAAKTRSTAARTKSVTTSTGSRRGRSKA